MGRFTSYDSMIKEMLRDRDWDKITVGKAVTTLNNSPDFLLRSKSKLFVEVALEEYDKFQVLIKLLPEVAKEVYKPKLEVILESLLTEESLLQKVNVRDKVIESFGWGIETIIQGSRKDEELVKKYVEVLNNVGDSLEEEGYHRIVVNLAKGTIIRTDRFNEEDLQLEELRVDIVTHQSITHSNQNY